MYLLDVNVLVAMQYAQHVHYARVNAWAAALYADRKQGNVVFATCPITELGFLRIASGKAAHAPSVDSARSDLHTLKARQKMLFIPDDVPARRLPAWVHKSPQTTDGYLLALAKAHSGHLATLDRFIPGALLVPDDTLAPLTVREEGVLSEWEMPLRTGSQPDSSHWQ
jgi:predicted nucleic acid-binding protein